MGGFEMHYFRKMERDLTKVEVEEVSGWSSRGEVTRDAAKFVYHYGSFKKKEDWALEQYFDVMVYYDGYGCRRLMYKLPLKFAGLAALRKFTIDIDSSYTCSLQLTKRETCNLLAFDFGMEEGDWMEEDSFDLTSLCNLHEAILDEDYRAIYLFWSFLKYKEAEFQEDYDDEEEDDDDNEPIVEIQPDVPPNFKKSDKTISALIDFFEIDEEVVEQVTKDSPKVKVESVAYEPLIKSMAAKEKDEWLLKLLNGESGLAKALKKRLK
jgi:hypothetical protein